MTPRERESLARLAEDSTSTVRIPRHHAEKFVNHGLAVKEVLRFRITPKGQLELLRQRFRKLSASGSVHITGHNFISLLERELPNFRKSMKAVISKKVTPGDE